MELGEYRTSLKSPSFSQICISFNSLVGFQRVSEGRGREKKEALRLCLSTETMERGLTWAQKVDLKVEKNVPHLVKNQSLYFAEGH